MIEQTMLIFWGIWLFLILLAAIRVVLFPIARRIQDRRWRKGSESQKSVALIIPVKGFDLQATPRFFDSIFDQNYRHYRVIVCFETWDDPVAKWLCEHLELNPKRTVWNHPDPDNGLRQVILVAAGLSESEGQKVHNQRAAFDALTEEDEIIVFADSDILCTQDWLTKLVAPINCGTNELSTTYRWLIPKRPSLPNQLASVINASITTQSGNALTTILWGGSMALTREVFQELDVPTLLSGSLNDDLRLSKAARAKGKKIAFVRSLILPTPIDFNWRSFFEFARRQYTQVKFFSPILYGWANLVLGVYVLGVLTLAAAIIYGYFLAWVPVAAAYVIDQFRALARQQIYLSLYRDTGTRQKLFASSWLEHMLTPFWITLHWIILVSTWLQNKITWAGVRYKILSKSKTRILHRAETAIPLPPGAPGLAMIGALHDRRPPGTHTRPIRPLSSATGAVSTTFTSQEPTTSLRISDAAEVVHESTSDEPLLSEDADLATTEADSPDVSETATLAETDPSDTAEAIATGETVSSDVAETVATDETVSGDAPETVDTDETVSSDAPETVDTAEAGSDDADETDSASKAPLTPLRIGTSFPSPPSAILPLTTSFHTPPSQSSDQAAPPPKRGLLTAVEIALQKTRHIPQLLYTDSTKPQTPTPETFRYSVGRLKQRAAFAKYPRRRLPLPTKTLARRQRYPFFFRADDVATPELEDFSPTCDSDAPISPDFPIFPRSPLASRRPSGSFPRRHGSTHRSLPARSSRTITGSRAIRPLARPLPRGASARP